MRRRDQDIIWEGANVILKIFYMEGMRWYAYKLALVSSSEVYTWIFWFLIFFLILNLVQQVQNLLHIIIISHYSIQHEKESTLLELFYIIWRE